jgi:integrase
MLIEMGFSPLEIADRLGHESVKTTLDTYSHLYPDKDNELAGRLNQFRRKQE